MKEFDLIRFIRKHFDAQPGAGGLSLPIGDDCSVIAPPKGFMQATTADSMVDGNHFSSAHFTPKQIGQKTLRVNLSDLAAMGATGPYYAWLTLVLPKEMKDSLIKGIILGLKDDCKRFGVVLAGGNVTSANEFSIHLTLTGWVKKNMLTRKGAKPGDLICVTGTIGPSTMAYRQFKAGLTPEPALLKRWATPTPRMEAGILLAQKGIATACIDISDGIFQDLKHITTASGTGATVEYDKLPIDPVFKDRNPTPDMIGFGEDYELLFTLPPAKEKLLSLLPCPVTVIGRITESGFSVLDDKGKKMDVEKVGWEIAYNKLT